MILLGDRWFCFIFLLDDNCLILDVDCCFFSPFLPLSFSFKFWELVHFWKWVLGSLVLVDVFLFLYLFLLEMIFNCGDVLLFFL